MKFPRTYTLKEIAQLTKTKHIGDDNFPVKGINFAGLVAALLYAISPTVIIYSRSSWNPNIMPFFALLSV